ncbi:MAG: hypothetical protein AB7T27_04390 [Kiritimatiellia bacterium]
MASAVFWLFIGIICIESAAFKYLAPRFFSHEMDELLWKLEHDSYDKSVVMLGDSVGRQISLAMRSMGDTSFAPLATSAAVETAGQYFVFLRYLEHNRNPDQVILFMRNPLDGDLKKVCTENYVQRCFTRWHELASLTWQTRNPAFGLRMLTYRLASAKYRLHLQRAVPSLAVKDPFAGIPADQLQERKKELKKKSAWERLAGLALPRSTETVSEYYFLKLLDECKRRDIPLYFQPTPMRASKMDTPEETARRGALMERMRELAVEYPGFAFSETVSAYPDEYFIDGIHIQKKNLPEICDDYAGLFSRITGEGILK